MSSFRAEEVCFLFFNPYCLMMCYILSNQSLELDVQILGIFLCVFGNMFYYLNISSQILSNKFNLIAPYPPTLTPSLQNL